MSLYGNGANPSNGTSVERLVWSVVNWIKLFHIKQLNEVAPLTGLRFCQSVQPYNEKSSRYSLSLSVQETGRGK